MLNLNHFHLPIFHPVLSLNTLLHLHFNELFDLETHEHTHTQKNISLKESPLKFKTLQTQQNKGNVPIHNFILPSF